MIDPLGPSAFRILDYVPSGCCVVSGEGIVEFWNQTLEQWTGMGSCEVLGKSLFRVFPNLGEPRYRDRILAALRQGVPTLFSSALNPSFVPCTKPSGRPRIQDTTITRLEPDAQGRPRVLIVASDVTEQVERGEKYRQARTQALQEAEVRRESEERLRIIGDLSRAAILIGDPGGRIREASKACRRLFGWGAQEFTRLTLAELVQDPISQRLDALMAGGLDPGEDDLEVLCRRKNGGTFPAQVFLRHMSLGQGDQFVAYIWDISDRKRSEELLRQAQRQESLGVMAGGIAHDFNNHFGAVLGNLDLIESRLPGDSPIASYLGRVREEILRAAELSRKMLALSGGNPLVVTELELNAFLRRLEHECRARVPAGAELVLAPCGEPVVVEADASQLEQAILGLVTNAGEALLQGQGLVEIGTGSTHLDAEALGERFPLQPLEPGDFGFIRIADNGCGISPEHLRKIFDPFFSTKFSGRGLSLAFIRSILRAHGGGCELESTPGKGTTFTAFLPKRPEQASRAVSGPQRTEAAVAEGLILVVDDEPVLRESTSELLLEMGYRVRTASNGLEALEFYRSHPGQVALVLMDMTMPVMGGKEAFQAIRSLDPTAKIILTSGYSEQDVTLAFRSGELVAFLPKPYRMKDLARAVEGAVGVP